MRGIIRGLDEKSDSAFNKGGDNLMETASEIKPTIFPKGGAIRLRIWSNPLLFPLFAHMGVAGWDKTLLAALLTKLWLFH